MERAEKIGLGVAVTGHLALFAVLSLSLLFRDDKPKLGDPTVEITIAGDPGSSELLSESLQPIAQPEPSEALPQEATSPLEELVAAPPEASSPPPPSRESESLPPDRSAELKRQREAEARKKSEADARRKRDSDAKAKRDADSRSKREADEKAKRDAAAKRKKAAEERRAAIAKAARDAANAANAANSGPPAKNAGQVRGEVNIAIGQQIRPFLRGCTPNGPDVRNIVTRVTLKLNKNGSLSGLSGVSQTGINDTNRTQSGPMEECVLSAIRKASPFSGLDGDYYDVWQSHKMAFKGS